MFHNFDKLIGWPLYDVVSAAAKFQLNTFIVREYSGKKFKTFKVDVAKPVLLLSVEDGKVTNICLEQ